MCGIVGYVVGKRAHAPVAFEFFTKLMEESRVRGMHASGASWIANGKVRTLKAPIPAWELVSGAAWDALRRSTPMQAIGHTRYSTSGDWQDNANNQPVATSKLAVVHNGLVSMADQKTYEAAYDVKTTSANDTEVILRRVLAARGSLSSAFDRIYTVQPPIFACGFLDDQGRVTAIRDHIRPLWLFRSKALSLTGFASTRDIVLRALEGLGEPLAGGLELWEAEPYTEYGLTASGAQELSRLKYAQPSEVRFPRPSIQNRLMLTAKKPKAPLELDTTKYKQADHRKRLRQSFKQYCVAAIASWEIDPNYPLMNYLFRRYELSKSQEYWACFLYGTFYHPGSVFYVMQEFPEFEKVDLKRLDKWHKANWRALAYNTDRKYEKGHFVEMFESYRDTVGGQTPTAQEEFFAQLLKHGKTDEERFRVVEAKLRTLWHFGRYATYIYTEALHRCMGMPIKADTMFLREAQSSRTGLAYALNLHATDVQQVKEAELLPEEWDWLLGEGEKLLTEIQREYPKLGMDHWFMESCLCAYKGFFRPTKGRYLPYYLDRMANEINQMRDAPITSGIDWNVLYQFRHENIIPEYLGELATPPRTKVDKSKEHVLRDTGRMIGLWPIVQRGLIK